MCKVLVVEDEELIRTMIKINLERAGYQVECCPDAESMLELLDEGGAALIMLDIMLPGMSGEEALKAVRQKNAAVPVIMVTAKTDLDSKVNTLDQGADDYIAKPFEMKELLARVNALLRRCRVQAEVAE